MGIRKDRERGDEKKIFYFIEKLEKLIEMLNWSCRYQKGTVKQKQEKQDRDTDRMKHGNK